MQLMAGLAGHFGHMTAGPWPVRLRTKWLHRDPGYRPGAGSGGPGQISAEINMWIGRDLDGFGVVAVAALGLPPPIQPTHVASTPGWGDATGPAYPGSIRR